MAMRVASIPVIPERVVTRGRRKGLPTYASLKVAAGAILQGAPESFYDDTWHCSSRGIAIGRMATTEARGVVVTGSELSYFVNAEYNEVVAGTRKRVGVGAAEKAWSDYRGAPIPGSAGPECEPAFKAGWQIGRGSALELAKRLADALETVLSGDPDMPTYESDLGEADKVLEEAREVL